MLLCSATTWTVAERVTLTGSVGVYHGWEWCMGVKGKLIQPIVDVRVERVHAHPGHFCQLVYRYHSPTSIHIRMLNVVKPSWAKNACAFSLKNHVSIATVEMSCSRASSRTAWMSAAPQPCLW
jgi:hypothetical protein